MLSELLILDLVKLLQELSLQSRGHSLLDFLSVGGTLSFKQANLTLMLMLNSLNLCVELSLHSLFYCGYICCHLLLILSQL